MPLFCLMPLASGLNDPDWSASLHRGPCHVGARDARRARLYAASAFANTAAPRSEGGLLPLSPWTRPDLVTVDRAVGVFAATVEEGSVMLPGTTGNPGHSNGVRPAR
jgi:hypothetical protein